MKLKTIVTSAVVVLSTFARAAEASPVWTITMHGTIYSGIDVTGWFGQAGQNLAGLKYTQTITSDADPNQYSYHYSDDGISIMNGSVPYLTDAVTINGKSIFFDLVKSPFAGQYIKDAATRGGSDYISVGVSGYDSAGVNWVQASGYIYTDIASGAFVPNLDFSQSMNVSTGNGRYGNSTFYVETNGHYSADFSSTTDTITFSINSANGENDVPEPISINLFGLGALGMVAMHRRKKS